MEGLGRGRKRGGRQTDSFATLSGHEEEGQSPEVPQRTKQVCHPYLEKRQKEPPTQHRGSESGEGPPQQPLGLVASLEVFVLFCFCTKGVFGGMGCPGEELGLWGIGGGRGTREGVILPHPRKGRSSPPNNLWLFLAAQGIRE